MTPARPSPRPRSVSPPRRQSPGRRRAAAGVGHSASHADRPRLSAHARDRSCRDCGGLAWVPRALARKVTAAPRAGSLAQQPPPSHSRSRREVTHGRERSHPQNPPHTRPRNHPRSHPLARGSPRRAVHTHPIGPQVHRLESGTSTPERRCPTVTGRASPSRSIHLERPAS
ncbi:hypothetical protein ACFPRL_13035 [Pseudoclavibacter helvolus]